MCMQCAYIYILYYIILYIYIYIYIYIYKVELRKSELHLYLPSYNNIFAVLLLCVCVCIIIVVSEPRKTLFCTSIVCEVKRNLVHEIYSCRRALAQEKSYFLGLISWSTMALKDHYVWKPF